MNKTKRFYIAAVIFALLTFMLAFPVAGTDEAVTNDILVVAAAPEDVATEEEVFEGNAIGKALDKTFYKMDYAIFTAFSKIQNDILTPIVNAVTHLGDTEFAIPMIVLGLILSLFKKTRKVGLTLFLAIIIGTLFTNVVLKNVCGRARPYVTLSGDADFMSWYTRAGANIESDNSFPSGHTTCAFEIGIALMLTIRKNAVRWIFPVYSVVIMCTRLYLMVHYSSDVFAGVIVGTCAGIIAYFIVKKLLQNEKFANSDIRNISKKKAAK